MRSIRLYNTFDIAVPIVHKFKEYLDDNSEEYTCKFVVSSIAYRSVSELGDDSYLESIKIPTWLQRKKSMIHLVYLVKALLDIVKSDAALYVFYTCLLYTSPSPRDRTRSRMPSSA